MAEMRREHHQKILKVLRAMNVPALKDMQCYFAGGTAISMLLNEYRESVDIDFMCSSREGYALLREAIFDRGINALFHHDAPTTVRELRSDMDGVRTVLNVDGTPIKLEIVREARIDLEGEISFLPVPTLSKKCLFAEKLLANTDRGLDKSSLSKDMLDIIMMEHEWGFDEGSLAMAEGAYRSGVMKSYNASIRMLSENRVYLDKCLESAKIEGPAARIIRERLIPEGSNNSNKFGR